MLMADQLGEWTIAPSLACRESQDGDSRCTVRLQPVGMPGWGRLNGSDRDNGVAGLAQLMAGLTTTTARTSDRPGCLAEIMAGRGFGPLVKHPPQGPSHSAE